MWTAKMEYRDRQDKEALPATSTLPTRADRVVYALMAREATRICGQVVKCPFTGRIVKMMQTEGAARRPSAYAVRGDWAWYKAWWMSARLASSTTGKRGNRLRRTSRRDLLVRVLRCD